MPDFKHGGKATIVNPISHFVMTQGIVVKIDRSKMLSVGLRINRAGGVHWFHSTELVKVKRG